MAIVIHEQPAERALIGSGQTQYTFYGDERIAAGGVVAINRLSLYEMLDGDQVKLAWNGQEVTLTARTAPSGPYDIPTGGVTISNTAYLTQVLPYLRELYLLRQDFTIEVETTAYLGYRLTAKKPGPAYNFTETVIAFKKTVINLTPGRLATIRPRYSVHLTLRVQRPLTPGTDLEAHYEPIFNAPVETGEDGFAQFDVAPLLEGYLSSSFPDTTPRLDQTSHRRYYVEYAEAYGDPIQVGRVQQSALFHMYRGGASTARQSGSGFSLDGFVRAAGRKDYALRLGPLRRYIAPDSMQFLSFLNVGAALPSVAIQVNASFDNGFAQERIDLTPAQSWPAAGVLTFAVGPDQLGLATLLPSSTLSQYTIRLVNAATRELLSEPYSFVIDYAVRPYARQFAYINSLGVVDVITTWGKGSTEFELFSEQAERTLSLPFSADEGTGEVYDATYQERLSVATGFRPLTELRAWRDFYRSTQRWWLKRPLNRLVVDARLPIGLDTKSIRETKDGENLTAHQFNVVVLRKEHYYSPDDDLLDEPLPPRQFQPAGSVTVQAVTVVQTRDPTISDAARNFTSNDLENLRRVVTFGDPNTKGFLKQPITDQLYRTAEEPVPVTEVQGLTDVVYTRAETDNQQAQQATTQIRQNTQFRVLAVPASFQPA